MVSNSRNLISYSSEGQKSKLKVLARLHSFGRFRRESIPWLTQNPEVTTILGTWPINNVAHHSHNSSNHIPLPCNDPCDYVGPTQQPQITFLAHNHPLKIARSPSLAHSLGIIPGTHLCQPWPWTVSLRESLRLPGPTFPTAQ